MSSYSRYEYEERAQNFGSRYSVSRSHETCKRARTHPPTHSPTHSSHSLTHPLQVYWLILELKFTLRSMVHTAHRSHESALFLGHTNSQLTLVDPEVAGQHVADVGRLVHWVNKLERGRIEATRKSDSHMLPRLVRLSDRYGLDDKSLNMLQLLVISMSVTSVALNSALQEYTENFGAHVFRLL